ncbi:hypothetical protein ACOMHN_024491 [Nucella lapillus]
MGGQPSDAPALSPPSPLQQGGQSSNAPALSPPSPLPQGGQPIALALSPPSPPPQGGQPSDAPGLSPSSSTLLLCPSDSTLNICHLNSQSAVKTVLGNEETGDIYHRDCKHGKSKTECLKRELRNSVRTEACKCSTSLCNSAPPGGPRAAPANHWVTLATLVVMVAVLTSVF